MADAPARFVIVLWAAGPERPDLAAAPFVYALAARAMELDVEMHYTATSVRWLLPGVAGAAFADEARTKSVLDYIRETKAAGARHFACAMALARHGGGAGLIEEADGVAGAATVIGAAARPGVRALVF
jgi:predicted peroxiredoxin